MFTRKIVLYYVVIACLILGPAMGRGFIFLLDMPWAPMIQLSDYTKHGLQPHLPLIILLRVLNAFIPGWAVQKLLLLGILAGIGTAVYLASHSLNVKLKLKLKSKEAILVSLYAGTLAMLNPFVYERLLAGQWLVLCGYGYTAILAWLYLKYGARRIFWVAYIFFPIFSVHIWIITTCIALLGAGVIQVAHKSLTIRWLDICKVVGVFSVVHAFWIIPTLLGNNDLASEVSASDFTIFKTASDSQVGVIGNVISLYGLWRPVNDMKDDHLLWFFYGLTLFSLSLYVFARIRNRSLLSKKFAVFGIVSLTFGVLFSIGYGSELTSFILSWIKSIPGAATLRDTAKVIAILAVCTSVFPPVGIVLLAQKYKWRVTKPIVAGFFITMIMMSGMLFGLGGNLTATDYPRGWYTVRDRTKKEDTVLILPWQGYLDINFARDRYMANPAEVFFDAQTLISKSTGNVGLDDKDDYIEDALNKVIDESGTLKTIQENIQPKPSHVIVLKTGNWHRYDAVVSANKANIAFEDSSIILLKISNH